MGCMGYRDRPCECEDGGKIFDKNYQILTAYSGNSAYPHVICRVCNCITKAVLHLDVGLESSKGTPGIDGDIDV